MWRRSSLISHPADGPVLPHRDRAALRGEGGGLRAVPAGEFHEGAVQAGDGAGGVEGMKNYIIQMPGDCRPKDCADCNGRKYIKCKFLPNGLFARAMPLVEVIRPNKRRITARDGSVTYTDSAPVRFFVLEGKLWL